MLTNLWLRMRGYITERLKGYPSRQNPVLLLPRDVHQIISMYQQALKLFDPAAIARMSVRRFLELNRQALYHAGLDKPIIDEIMLEAARHARDIMRMRRVGMLP